MRPPRGAKSFSEVLRLLLADVRRLTQALRRSPPPPYMPDVELKIFEACCDHYKLIDGSVCTERPNYTTPFPQEATRCIWCILRGHSVKWQLTKEYTLTFNIYRHGMLVYHKTEDKVEIPLKYDGLSHFTWRTFGCGWREPGHWSVGEYQAVVLIDGVKAATGHFTIAPPPPPAPPPSPAEVLQQPRVRFYASAFEAFGAFGAGGRLDSIRFPQETTREVICELMVRNLLYRQQDRTYSVTMQCYTVEGRLLWEDKRNWIIPWQVPGLSILWDCQTSGWSRGIYRVEIIIDGVNFAWGAFLIE